MAREGPGSLLFLLSRGGGYTGRRNFYLFTLASWLTLSPLWLADGGESIEGKGWKGVKGDREGLVYVWRCGVDVGIGV